MKLHPTQRHPMMPHLPTLRSITEAIEDGGACVCGVGVYDLSVHEVNFEIELGMAAITSARQFLREYHKSDPNRRYKEKQYAKKETS